MIERLKTEREFSCTLSPTTSWYLERYLKNGNTCRIPIDTFPFQIGRCKDCQFILPLKYISRYHAALMIHDDKSLTLFDLGSLNGIYVNSRKIEESAVVKSGDMLHFVPEKMDSYRLICYDNDDSIIQKMQFTENVNRRKQYIDGKDFNFIPNTFLLIEIKKNGSPIYMETQLLAQQKGLVLITTLPSSLFFLPMMGDKCRVRYLSYNKIYDFEALVVRIELHSRPHLFLTYPENLSFIGYRRYKRHKVSLGAIVRSQYNGQLFNGTITDISSGGCKIAFPTDRVSEFPKTLLLTIEDTVRDIGILKRYETQNETSYLVGCEFAEYLKSYSVSNVVNIQHRQ